MAGGGEFPDDGDGMRRRRSSRPDDEDLDPDPPFRRATSRPTSPQRSVPAPAVTDDHVSPISPDAPAPTRPSNPSRMSTDLRVRFSTDIEHYSLGESASPGTAEGVQAGTNSGERKKPSGLALDTHTSIDNGSGPSGPAAEGVFPSPSHLSPVSPRTSSTASPYSPNRRRGMSLRSALFKRNVSYQEQSSSTELEDMAGSSQQPSDQLNTERYSSIVICLYSGIA